MKTQKLEVPFGEKKILLHCCCAPCSSAIVECLLANSVRPTIFYFNPNIFPPEEYKKRRDESLRHAKLLGLEHVDADCSHEEWLGYIRGLEREPERGARCLKCFEMRLIAAAKYASENGFKVFATTLASSRWKDICQINLAGELAAKKYPQTFFWAHNWRKGGLSERRGELLKEYGFYNQQYCGCEFSIRKQ